MLCRNKLRNAGVLDNSLKYEIEIYAQHEIIFLNRFILELNRL